MVCIAKVFSDLEQHQKQGPTMRTSLPSFYFDRFLTLLEIRVRDAPHMICNLAVSDGFSLYISGCMWTAMRMTRPGCMARPR
jgi:hypothetical protein